MRTTLKRGINRSAAERNGHAVLPPSIYSPVTRYVQPRKRRGFWRWLGRFLVALVAVLVLLVLGSAGGAYLYYHQSVAAVVAHSKDVKIAAKHLDIPLPNQPATALIVGYDHRWGEKDRGRSDTLMLLRADPTTKSISMLSLPRDLLTTLWCGNHIVATNDRINDAYTLCGSNGVLSTVKRLTGLRINYLITVNFMGFIQAVNRVGGVWVDVDRRYFNKNVGTIDTNFSNIDLKPGYQRLDGVDALAYVRYRHTDSDLYRIARQQQFVKAFKAQISSNFSVWTLPKLVGAITGNVEVAKAGGGSLEGDIKKYALFAYGLPSGHFFQSKVDVTGGNTLDATPQAIQAAVHDFETPDVEAPAKATAVTFGRKAAGIKAPAPRNVTISVLNGNGVTGSATNAGYELGQRGYRILVPASTADMNAPTFGYFHSQVYYDPRQAASKAAAAQVANLFGDGAVHPLPTSLRSKADRAMLTVIVGSTFHGTLAPAPSDQTPAKQPPHVRVDPGQSESLLRSEQHYVNFPLMVPTTVEASSYIDSEMPMRAYQLKPGQPTVRLTFLDNQELVAYWGIQETAWNDAPVLSQPSFRHTIDGRKYDFYYDGPHLHMVVLRTPKASYWVVNTLVDSLSNETMIAIAKGLRPLPRH
jgi:LCP family protein required for cell wall assembly